ncbi:hypothetical protein FT641_18760 [Bacillus paranthracis]|uniref:hypothetical protein n=1 Tax=Bacillus paranthracis TaxID=2026186 RepID=UPI001879620F|nr:hypothetical protein [Bacillus paranthracis]MBE7114394.1 hypothetical protein [Bacillus paranthracis]MBE7154733.1 hypothetical protein [Bacillus paranthracis]
MGARNSVSVYLIGFLVCLAVAGLLSMKYVFDYLEAKEIVDKGDIRQMQVLEKEINDVEKSLLGKPVYKIKIEDGDASRVLEVDKDIYDKTKKGSSLSVSVYKGQMIVKDWQE